MRGRRPLRIYLLPELPAKRFSRTQDPKLLCLSLLRSLRFDLSGANDLAPFLGIFCDHGGEIGRGPRQYNARHVGNPRLDCRIGEGGINRFIEFIDDLGWRISGRADPVPRACLVAGDKVGNWSKVGEISKRVVLVTPNARSLPVLTYPIDAVVGTKMTSTCPLTMSINAGIPPR